MKTKHTQGPLKVVADSNWPFDLITYDSLGEERFRTPLPCHSTRMKSFKDALDGVGFEDKEGKFSKESCIISNNTAYNDEVLRAAAPELLEALQGICNILEITSLSNKPTFKDDFIIAQAAIKKAIGE